MKGIIIFKISRNYFGVEDYEYYASEAYGDVVRKLKAEAKKWNREFVITAAFGDTQENIIESVPYLEILHTGELAIEERDAYLDLVKCLFSDGNRREEFIPKLIIRFQKLNEDNVFVVRKREKVDLVLKELLSEE